MALGDKRFVVHTDDMSTPGGPATLDENGKLEKNQRPGLSVCGVEVDEAGNVPLTFADVPIEDDNGSGDMYRMGVENGIPYMEIVTEEVAE